jgi:translation initiation factor 1 (eIF-1/SUI1)
MASPLSMTTTKKPKKRGFRMKWRVKRDQFGELKFFPIKDESSVKTGGAIFATMTLKMIQDDDKEEIIEAIKQIREAGGAVTQMRGRRMYVEVDGDSVDEVGTVLDSFGCQWELN